MLLNYNYSCDKCYDKKNSQTLESFICKCGGEFKLERLNLYDPLTPYWSENMGRYPVLVESRSHRQQLMRERKLDIIPDKKYDKPRVVRGKDGHKLSQHQIEVAQKKGFSIAQ